MTMHGLQLHFLLDNKTPYPEEINPSINLITYTLYIIRTSI